MKLDSRLIRPFGIFVWSILTISFFTTLPTSALAEAASTDTQALPVSAIARMLGGNDLSEFKAAQVELKKLGQSAMPELLRIGNSGTDQERQGAVMGLAFMPIPQLTIDGLISFLNSPDKKTQGLAALILTKIGTPAAHQVAGLLGSPDERLRHAAAFILRKMGKDAVPALIATLSTEKPLLRANAAWILGEIGPEARLAIPALIRALPSSDPRALHVVAEAIDLISKNPLLMRYHLLQIGLTSDSLTLGRIGKKAVPTLIALLSRTGTPIAQAAYATLARIGEPAKPALIESLKSGNPNQRIAAALLITTIDPRAGHAIPEDLRKTLAGALKENQTGE